MVQARHDLPGKLSPGIRAGDEGIIGQFEEYGDAFFFTEIVDGMIPKAGTIDEYPQRFSQLAHHGHGQAQIVQTERRGFGDQEDHL